MDFHELIRIGTLIECRSISDHSCRLSIRSGVYLKMVHQQILKGIDLD